VTGVICAAARRAIDIRVTRSYILIPVRGDGTVTLIGEKPRLLSGWQHLTIPGDLQVHVTKEVPKTKLVLTGPWADSGDWRTIASVVARSSASEMAVVGPARRNISFGPGVLVVAPDAPSHDERWRLVVEILAGPPTSGSYPLPPFQDLQPIPMRDGNVVLRAAIKDLLPKATRPAAAEIAIRGWWTEDEETPSGILAFV